MDRHDDYVAYNYVGDDNFGHIITMLLKRDSMMPPSKLSTLFFIP